MLQRVSLQFFFHFATEWMFKKSQRVSLLHFSALCDLPKTSKKFKKNPEIFFSSFGYCRSEYLTLWSPFVFLSLRYGADFGRSLLVHKNILLQNTKSIAVPLRLLFSIIIVEKTDKLWTTSFKIFNSLHSELIAFRSYRTNWMKLDGFWQLWEVIFRYWSKSHEVRFPLNCSRRKCFFF